MQTWQRTAVGTVALVLFSAGAGGAQAASPAATCEASALRATIAGQAVEPVVAGRDGACATTQATPSATLPPLLDAQALVANTDAAGSATGGLARLAVLPVPDLLGQLPTEQAIDALEPVTVGLDQLLKQLDPLLAPLVAALAPGGIQLDVREAVRALVPVPGSAVLSADVLTATATARCVDGAAQLSGISTITGLKLLGQDLGVDGVLSQAVTLIDTQNISLARLDLTKVTILTPLGSLLAPVQAALAPVLAALPPIQLPASVAQVTLAAGEQVREAGALTQRALRARIGLAGQTLLDAVVGEAKVTAADEACALPAPPPPPPPAPAPEPPPVVQEPRPEPPAPKAAPVAAQGVAAEMLRCTDRKLVLVDVLRRGDRVKLLGAANRNYVGRRVAIRLRATGRVVAHAKVRRDGSFQTTAPMPPAALLATNKLANEVRYRAEIGRERSLPLKLQRRMVVSSLRSRAGKVTIAGRVTGPLTTPISTIRLVRRASCHKVVLVKRFKPNADGTFRVTVKAPKGQSAAVYRMVTSVREKPSNPRNYPTYTLPRGVALNTR